MIKFYMVWSIIIDSDFGSYIWLRNKIKCLVICAVNIILDTYLLKKTIDGMVYDHLRVDTTYDDAYQLQKG
jgi:hypothetical protein